MLLIDDLLKAPGKAVFFLFEELAKKAQEEWLDDESVKHELQQIYALLDTGKIGEQEFEARERNLLERLEQIARVKFQSKWREKEPDTASEPPLIEGALSVRSFENALVPENQESLAAPMNGGSQSSSSSSSLAGKLSLGADFFQALRPFLDLPTASATPFCSESQQQSAAFQLPATSRESLMASDEPDSSSLLIEAFTEPPLVNSESSDVGRIGNSTVAAERSSLETPSGISNQGISPGQTIETPPADAAASCRSVVDGALGFSGAVENAMRALSVTKLKTSSVTSVVSRDDGWCVSVELIERKAVPDTNDLLGVYEVHLNKTGIVTRYERTRVRRRNDLTR